MSSVYVHLPWCEQKCPYCDFNSHVQSERDEAAYVDALLRDLECDASWLAGPIQTVFFGGGTPSLFAPASIGRILKALDNEIGIAPGCEITLEANPGSSEQSKFAGFKAAGVNRLSIGIQSFEPAKLARLGRIHSGDEALQAVKAAQQAGFERINVDLMHGLPEQTPAQAIQDLDQALALGVEHLSWYQLTLEPNTAFYKHPPPLPAEDDLAEIQDQGFERLQRAGFEQYEISAFSRPGKASRHNLNYWQFGDYLGLGAGAHGKVTRQGQILRSQKTRMPQSYIEQYAVGAPPVFKPVDAQALPFEFMLNQLRLRAGCAEEAFEARTGLPLDRIYKPLAECRSLGLIEPDRIQATELGWRYLNDVIERFL